MLVCSGPLRVLWHWDILSPQSGDDIWSEIFYNFIQWPSDWLKKHLALVPYRWPVGWRGYCPWPQQVCLTPIHLQTEFTDDQKVLPTPMPKEKLDLVRSCRQIKYHGRLLTHDRHISHLHRSPMHCRAYSLLSHFTWQGSTHGWK